MNRHDSTYHDFLKHILSEGVHKGDRTGTGTQSVFGYQMRFNLMKDGFPLISTKNVHFKSIAHELLWFLKGDTNIAYLKENGVSIWDEWADENGDLGPIYGFQWRHWPIVQEGDGMVTMYHHDQITAAVQTLRENPDDRGIMVSAWNVTFLKEMALRPCHVLFQFYSRELTAQERLQYAFGADRLQGLVTERGLHEEMDKMSIPERLLSVQVYQRSADAFLGVCFNIASYALLLEMMAHVTRHAAGEVVWTGGDCHIYSNHREQVMTQLARSSKGRSPLLSITREVKEIDDFTYADFQLLGYDPHDSIKAPVAV